MATPRPADTYRAARRNRAKRLKLDWRQLERARQSLRYGSVTVRLPRSAWKE